MRGSPMRDRPATDPSALPWTAVAPSPAEPVEQAEQTDPGAPAFRSAGGHAATGSHVAGSHGAAGPQSQAGQPHAAQSRGAEPDRGAQPYGQHAAGPVIPGPVRPSARPAGEFPAQAGPARGPEQQSPLPTGWAQERTQQHQQHQPQPVQPQAAQQQPRYAPVPQAAQTSPTGLPVLPTLDPWGTATAPTVDPQVARELKRQVAAELHNQLSRLTGTHGHDSDLATRRQRGRALIEESVARWSDSYAQTHGVPPTREHDRALAEAVYDLLFRAGRLQPYLDDPEIENILINGCDDVWISRVHQPLRQVPPVADSDAELVELLQDLARQHGGGERSLSTASPTLALRLEGGMRLQAMTEVTPRPYVAIRRHRVASATLSDLVTLGTVDPTLAAFLAAAIRARKNVMITGTQGVGKTSLLRAMAAEIPPDERVGTLESEFELWLHTLGHLRQVVPMEAREGNGERVDGKVAGELTIGELIPAALRMTLSRIIVGEVRSGEVVPMLRVMTNGEGGSMCTLHARGPQMVVDRIAELCLEYGSHMTDTLAYRLTANALDLIVHVAMVDETAVGGRRHRFVSHVMEVTGLGEQGRPALNTVFGPRPDLGEPRAVPHTPPNCLDDLRRVGFDAGLLQSAYGSWSAPLALRIGGLR